MKRLSLWVLCAGPLGSQVHGKLGVGKARAATFAILLSVPIHRLEFHWIGRTALQPVQGEPERLGHGNRKMLHILAKAGPFELRGLFGPSGDHGRQRRPLDPGGRRPVTLLKGFNLGSVDRASDRGKRRCLAGAYEGGSLLAGKLQDLPAPSRPGSGDILSD